MWSKCRLVSPDIGGNWVSGDGAAKGGWVGTPTCPFLSSTSRVKSTFTTDHDLQVKAPVTTSSTRSKQTRRGSGSRCSANLAHSALSSPESLVNTGKPRSKARRLQPSQISLPERISICHSSLFGGPTVRLPRLPAKQPTPHSERHSVKTDSHVSQPRPRICKASQTFRPRWTPSPKIDTGRPLPRLQRAHAGPSAPSAQVATSGMTRFRERNYQAMHWHTGQQRGLPEIDETR